MNEEQNKEQQTACATSTNEVAGRLSHNLDLPLVATVMGAAPATALECLHEMADSLDRMSHGSPWLTIREAESYARVRRNVVRDAIARGEVEAYRRTSTSQVLVRASAIDDWIERTWLSSTRKFSGAQR